MVCLYYLLDDCQITTIIDFDRPVCEVEEFAQVWAMDSSVLLHRISGTTSPFSSGRQHLSYDDCLEIRGEIRTVLCCIVY